MKKGLLQLTLTGMLGLRPSLWLKRSVNSRRIGELYGYLYEEKESVSLVVEGSRTPFNIWVELPDSRLKILTERKPTTRLKNFGITFLNNDQEGITLFPLSRTPATTPTIHCVKTNSCTVLKLSFYFYTVLKFGVFKRNGKMNQITRKKKDWL